MPYSFSIGHEFPVEVLDVLAQIVQATRQLLCGEKDEAMGKMNLNTFTNWSWSNGTFCCFLFLLLSMIVVVVVVVIVAVGNGDAYDKYFLCRMNGGQEKSKESSIN
jgi:hypothetical protein